MSARPGSTLIELIITLTVLGMIGVACAGLVRAQATLLRHASESVAGHETLRAAGTILRAELEDLTPADRRVVARDSLSLRVFRGMGIVCAINPPVATLRYTGVRQPDPAKDSLLAIANEQAGTIRQISTRAAACVHHLTEQLVALEPDFRVDTGTIVLFFESGAYYVSSNALRYRRGPGGLQPMTDDVIDHGVSTFALDANDDVRFTLRTRATNSYAFGSSTHVWSRNR